MELFLDTADIKEIKKLNEVLTIDGVTTNPSILAKTNIEPFETINELVKLLSPSQKLFVEVLANTCDEMVEEAKYISSLKENCYAKIPVSIEGLKAIKICKEKGYKTLATAIFTSSQGYLAAKNGADYLAPYVNRMENYMDGIDETIKLQETIWNNGFDSRVVAASFKNVNQIKQLMINDIDAVTIPVELAYKMIEHAGTDDAIEKFESEWKTAFNRTTLK